MTTVNLLELVSFIEAGLSVFPVGNHQKLCSPNPNSQLARGEAVSSMDRLFDGRVAGLRCWDVDLLSVFSARAAILSGRGRRLAGREARAQLLLLAGDELCSGVFARRRWRD